MRKLSQNGLESLKKMEGIMLNVYKDVAGYPSIGIGHKLTPDELKSRLIIIKGESHPWSNGLTENQVEDLKKQDIGYHESIINNHIKSSICQHQFDCLVSFSYNTGIGAFLNSTLFKKVNSMKFDEVPDELIKWIYITDPKTKKKLISNGLQNRRNAEVKLWKGIA